MDKRELEIIFCCFLWGDWPFGVDYVNNLYRAIRKNFSLEFTFICFLDRKNFVHGYEEGINLVVLPQYVVQMKKNLTKMFLFSDLLEKDRIARITCFDLDTIITGDITSLVMNRDPSKLYTCEAANPEREGKVGGSVTGFDYPNSFLTKFLWQKIVENYNDVVRKTNGSERIFFRKIFMQKGRMKRVKFWEREFPGAVKSFKWDYKTEDFDFSSMKILRFHGQPRPHEVNDHKILEMWNHGE